MAIQHNIRIYDEEYFNVYSRIGDCTYFSVYKKNYEPVKGDYSDPENPVYHHPVDEDVKTRIYKANVHTFKNGDTFTSESTTIRVKEYTLELTGSVSSSDNILEVMYNYIKTLPEFSGSIDV
jgi:hypothetical protein